MTKEQLKNDILVSMKQYISAEALGILSDVLTDRFQQIEIEQPQLLATEDNSNEYYLNMFNAFKGQRLSEKSMKMYNYALRKFMDLIHKNFTKVTSNDIDYFLMKQKNCSETSKNNYRRFLSAFFSWMVKKRIITFNPVNEVESFKTVKKQIDHLEPEEMEILRDGCTKSRERALIEFMRSTAVRVGELIKVKISDVDFQNGRVLVYGEKTKTYRTVLLDRVALGYLRKYLAERGADLNSDEYLFTSQRSGSSLTDSGIRCALNKIKCKSHINRRIYPHLFRKSCATLIMRRGGTSGDAGDYLGHSEDTVTGRHYIYKDDTHIMNIFNKYVAIV